MVTLRSIVAAALLSGCTLQVGIERESLGPAGVTEGLVLWLNAADPMSLPDMAGVPVWHDVSPARNDATAGATGAAPQRVPEALGGGPAVRFDAVDDLLIVPGITGLRSFDVFVVWQSALAPGNTAIADVIGLQPDDTHTNFEIQHSSPWDEWRCAGTVSQSSYYTVTAFASPSPSVPALWNLSFSEDDGELAAWTDGTRTSSRVGQPGVPDMGAPALGIGGRPVVGDRLFGGDIAEVAVFGRRLSATERAQVSDAMTTRWHIDR